MSALRLLASASRRAPKTLTTLGRRGYAEASDKISLSLVLPHQVRHGTASRFSNPDSNVQAIFTSTDVVQVNVAAATGDMGILANHVPSIEPLRPGVVEVIETDKTSKWFGTRSSLDSIPSNSDLIFKFPVVSPLSIPTTNLLLTLLRLLPLRTSQPR